MLTNSHMNELSLINDPQRQLVVLDHTRPKSYLFNAKTWIRPTFTQVFLFCFSAGPPERLISNGVLVVRIICIYVVLFQLL